MNRKTNAGALAALIATWLLAACGPDGRDGTAGATTDAPPWTLVEELRIGSMDDPDQLLTPFPSLYPQLSVLSFSDGRLWIHQSREAQFRVYDSDGTFLGVVGRRGAGPGEFANLADYGWWRGAGDTIWAIDAVNRRVSLLTSDGLFRRSFPWTPVDHSAVVPPAGGTWQPMSSVSSLTPDGEAVAPLLLESYRGSRLLRFDPETGSATGEIGELSRFYLARPHLDGQLYSLGTFGLLVPNEELVAFSKDGRSLVVADREAAGFPAVGYLPVHALAMNGDTLWSRSYPYSPVAIPRAEVDSLVANRTLAMVRRGAPAELVPRIVAESFPAPGHRPPVQSAFIDEEDRVWLEWIAPADGAPATWLVLGEGGEPVGRVNPPAGMNRIDLRAARGDHVWAIELDEFDVPYVVRYRIEAGG